MELILSARGSVATLLTVILIAAIVFAIAGQSKTWFRRTARTVSTTARLALGLGIDGIVAARQGPLVVPRAAKTGTLSIDDLRAVNFQSAARYGLNTISEVFQRDLQVHSDLARDLMLPLADVSTDRQRIYGTSDRGEMTEVDEFGRAPTQKIRGGTTVGFPLRSYQYALGWTRKYLQNATPAELVDQETAAKKAHMIQIARQVKRAIYLSANYTFNDFLVDKIDLPVKRFVNADSANIPDGPNGEAFTGSSHTHYDAINGITAAALKAAIRDVVEHGHGGKVIVAINIADEATISALTGFKDYVDPRTTLNGNAREATTRLDITRLDNRAIGIFDSAEIWVKPWAIANYTFTYDSSTSSKPLVLRTRNGTSPSLEIVAAIDTFPLYAEYMESEFGVGVWTRTNGHVLYFGGGSYTDPTIP